MSGLPPTLNEQQRLQYLKILGNDIGSAQRDGLFYANFVECLKNSPTDFTATEVVDRMQALGFASADWPESAGGPPPRRSLRPWKNVLDWLLDLLAKVGKFLLNAVAAATRLLHDLGLESVSIGIGWPLTVSFEFPKSAVQNNQFWGEAKKFLDDISEEMGSKLFAQ